MPDQAMKATVVLIKHTCFHVFLSPGTLRVQLDPEA